MPYLVVAGVTVQVSITKPQRADHEVGTVRRAFTGVPHSSVRARKGVWIGVETALISRTLADTLKAALEGAPPLSCSGDLTGAINCFVASIREVEKSRGMVNGVNTEMVRLSFDLMEE